MFLKMLYGVQDPSPTTPITPGPKSAKIQRRLTMILKEKEDLTEEEKAAILKKVCSLSFYVLSPVTTFFMISQ